MLLFLVMEILLQSDFFQCDYQEGLCTCLGWWKDHFAKFKSPVTTAMFKKNQTIIVNNYQKWRGWCWLQMVAMSAKGAGQTTTKFKENQTISFPTTTPPLYCKGRMVNRWNKVIKLNDFEVSTCKPQQVSLCLSKHPATKDPHQNHLQSPHLWAPAIRHCSLPSVLLSEV